MRIIFVPQYPSSLRYQEWWYEKLPVEFKKHGFDVEILGFDKIESMMNTTEYDPEMFSPIKRAIELETCQVMEYMNLDIRKDDILFVSDISFPGIFCNVLYHKRCSKMFAFCHATSLNTMDYFENVRGAKFPVETGNSKLFDKVFVGSKYHQDKLGWSNTIVTYLPPFPFTYGYRKQSKVIDIMSASRPTKQKVDYELERKVEKLFGVIQRPESDTWYEYFKNLQKSKILLITAHEDTFGYQIVDAVTNNCIPLARRNFAYPELLPDEYLYSTDDELLHKIDYILNADYNLVLEVPVPKLLCEKQMNKFYDVICKEMVK